MIVRHAPISASIAEDLSPDEVAAIRALLWAAFGRDGGFGEDAWRHTVGGTHVVLDEDDAILSHASVVARVLHVDGTPIAAGYVEGVATQRGRQGEGLGSAVMRDVNEHIDTTVELGALSTGQRTFYERLGWEPWLGPTSVRIPDGTTARTPEDDDGILFRRTPRTGPIDPDGPIACDWRPGDAW